jgi:hypothetical protein
MHAFLQNFCPSSPTCTSKDPLIASFASALAFLVAISSGNLLFFRRQIIPWISFYVPPNPTPQAQASASANSSGVLTFANHHVTVS